MSGSYDRLWAELAPVGRAASTGGYRRYAWTPVDALLREWFTGACAERGLDVTVDRNGNLWGWWGDPDDTPGLVLGSHVDSVPDGGAFDGPLGVISALAALDELRALGWSPTRPVGVAVFADEEGARFGVACAGSRLLTGVLDPSRARGLRDADGATLGEAIAQAGHDPRHLGRDEASLRRIGTFVELHVEQGRHLVDLDVPVGVGSRIWPHGRWRLDLRGRADHAGTTRLADRDDPMLALAAAVLEARSAAERHGAVATVGKVRVEPNGVNAIPSTVTAWLDARGPDAAGVRAVVDLVSAAAGSVPVEESWTAATELTAGVAGQLARLLGDAPLLETGAGHDAGILAAAGVPSAMLFVRNPTGVSHSPAEHAERSDCLAGVAALVQVLRALG